MLLSLIRGATLLALNGGILSLPELFPFDIIACDCLSGYLWPIDAFRPSDPNAGGTYVGPTIPSVSNLFSGYRVDIVYFGAFGRIYDSRRPTYSTLFTEICFSGKRFLIENFGPKFPNVPDTSY